MTTKETFAERLKTLREKYGFNQTQLADALGCVRVTIGYYEKGERSPDIEFLSKIADFFDVTTDYLLGKNDLPTMESEAIHRQTGLSEEAIKHLSATWFFATHKRNVEFDLPLDQLKNEKFNTRKDMEDFIDLHLHVEETPLPEETNNIFYKWINTINILLTESTEGKALKGTVLTLINQYLSLDFPSDLTCKIGEKILYTLDKELAPDVLLFEITARLKNLRGQLRTKRES